MNLIEGRQKAWAAGIVGFASAMVLQLVGAGDGPSDAQIADLAGMTGEIVVSLVVGALNWIVVYFKTNVVGGQVIPQLPTPTHPDDLT